LENEVDWIELTIEEVGQDILKEEQQLKRVAMDERKVAYYWIDW
jgi:hypothetical protein